MKAYGRVLGNRRLVWNFCSASWTYEPALPSPTNAFSFLSVFWSFGLLFYFIVCLGFEVLWFRSTLIRSRLKVVRTSVLPSFVDVSEMVAGAVRKNHPRHWSLWHRLPPSLFRCCYYCCRCCYWILGGLLIEIYRTVANRSDWQLHFQIRRIWTFTTTSTWTTPDWTTSPASSNIRHCHVPLFFPRRIFLCRTWMHHTHTLVRIFCQTWPPDYSNSFATTFFYCHCINCFNVYVTQSACWAHTSCCQICQLGSDLLQPQCNLGELLI